ncbi:MAG: YchJ family protein [Deltaproteobacteria bacterium]|nr:YchJ family protein [Deltaproteobacteria bacterium]
MSQCPCGSQKSYESCCNVYISGRTPAPTAEALMRSRYSAYVKHEIDYVERTHDEHTRAQFDRAAATAWSEQTDWKGLEIKSTSLGHADDAEGTVEFVARFATNGVEQTHHEISLFKRENGVWVYVDGKIMRVPVTRAEPKLGRNDPCSCGSGKKFKKCCGVS